MLDTVIAKSYLSFIDLIGVALMVLIYFAMASRLIGE